MVTRQRKEVLVAAFEEEEVADGGALATPVVEIAAGVEELGVAGPSAELEVVVLEEEESVFEPAGEATGGEPSRAAKQKRRKQGMRKKKRVKVAAAVEVVEGESEEARFLRLEEEAAVFEAEAEKMRRWALEGRKEMDERKRKAEEDKAAAERAAAAAAAAVLKERKVVEGGKKKSGGKGKKKKLKELKEADQEVLRLEGEEERFLRLEEEAAVFEAEAEKMRRWAAEGG